MPLVDIILLALLAALIVAALPSWPHSRKWGYGPAGLIALGTFIIIVVVVIDRL